MLLRFPCEQYVKQFTEEQTHLSPCVIVRGFQGCVSEVMIFKLAGGSGDGNIRSMQTGLFWLATGACEPALHICQA